MYVVIVQDLLVFFGIQLCCGYNVVLCFGYIILVDDSNDKNNISNFYYFWWNKGYGKFLCYFVYVISRK